jgi:hypothetical protein
MKSELNKLKNLYNEVRKVSITKFVKQVKLL